MVLLHLRPAPVPRIWQAPGGRKTCISGGASCQSPEVRSQLLIWPTYAKIKTYSDIFQAAFLHSFFCWGQAVHPEICLNSPAKCSKKPWDHAPGTYQLYPTLIWIAGIIMELLANFDAVHKLRSSHIGSEEFCVSQNLRRLMQNSGFLIESPTVSVLRLTTPSARPRRSKTKWVLYSTIQ